MQLWWCASCSSGRGPSNIAASFQGDEGQLQHAATALCCTACWLLLVFSANAADVISGKSPAADRLLQRRTVGQVAASPLLVVHAVRRDATRRLMV